MNIQVCHCGWTKLTTYQGLRIHQGKKGCTPKGMKVEESEQQYMWGNVGHPKQQQDLWVDVYASIKNDTKDVSLQMSLQVCHCGWTSVTTYHGLRTHQGKMGCTKKGVRIPATEQYKYENQWEEYHHRKHEPAKKEKIKKENVPVPSRITTGTKYTAPAAKIKEEYKAPAVSQRSNSAASQQLHEFFTSVQVKHRHEKLKFSHYKIAKNETYQINIFQMDRSIRERPTHLVYPVQETQSRKKKSQVTIKEEPYTPLATPHRSLQTATNFRSGHEQHDFSSGVQVDRLIIERPIIYLTPGARPKEKNKKDQTLSQVSARGAMTGYTAAAATIKEEPYTPLATPHRSLQTATNFRSGHEQNDFSSDVQVNRSVRDCPTTGSLPRTRPLPPPRPLPTSLLLPTVVRPKKKERKDQTSPQVNRSVRCPTVPPLSPPQPLTPTAHPLPTVVRPKNTERKDRTLSQAKLKSELELKIQMREEKMQKKEAERTCESVPDSTSTTTQTNSAAGNVTTKKDPKSLCETAQVTDFPTGMKVKQLTQMFSATTQETAVQRPKEKHEEERKLPQLEKPLLQKVLTIATKETAVQPKEQNREDQKLSLVPDSTSVTTKLNPAAIEATRKEDPKALCETAVISDFSTVLKVKQLAQMFSATTQETAVRPKVKHNEEQKLEQAKEETSKSNSEKVRMREEKMRNVIRAVERACECVPDVTSTTTNTNSTAADAITKEDPKSLCETAQVSDLPTGMKPKPLAQTYFATTTKETAVQPNEQDREDQTLSLVPDSTNATTKAESTTKEDPKALCETAALSDFSTGLKVKQLAWMFSTTNQETAEKVKKHQEERKPAQVKLLGQKLSATTTQETAKQKDWVNQKLSQVSQDRIPADVKHKVEMRERNVAEGRSSVKACKPSQGSLDRRPLESDGVLSEINSKSSKMEKINQKMEKPSPVNFEWITKFEVDVKLDPTTAHQCLVSADGKKVTDERGNQKVAKGPERFVLFGSVLGLNRLTTGKSYWEVEVSNKTAWDLGVARGDANRKGKLLLNPDDGYWAIVHFENKEYAALTAPPVHLSLKEKLQKVGVFVDYEDGLVSFYNVTAKSHIYSFTQCSFTGEICPYFSLHIGERTDPLVISTVKHQ
ncbi:nucleolar protein dao-5-like isoform X3 [Scomber scombrus]|uniref:Nucleolar protein dao-5-like isoform X3 n=1 Tax=Scomber scombrus TaxID=13677 RepID=A0AAV1PV54_SCOSC